MLKPKDIFKAVLYIDSSLAGFIQFEIEDSPRLQIKNQRAKSCDMRRKNFN